MPAMVFGDGRDVTGSVEAAAVDTERVATARSTVAPRNQGISTVRPSPP
jgi:hypothetical protein